MNDEFKDKVKQYISLKSDISTLEAKADELKVVIEEIMKSNNLDTLDTELGKLSMVGRKTWSYPQEITDLDTSLKDKKKESERLGTATYTENFSVRFFATKE
jgi:hypothetical protein